MLDKNLYILGAGGHASVVYELLLAQAMTVSGFIADECLSDVIAKSGIPLISESIFLQSQNADKASLVNGIGIQPHNLNRWQLSLNFENAGFDFQTITHPFSYISPSRHFGRGVQLFAGAVVQGNVHIGPHSIVNSSASIDHDVTIGENCHIAPGVTICGNVQIGNHVFIGAGSVIANNIQIADYSFIKAGSIVKNNM